MNLTAIVGLTVGGNDEVDMTEERGREISRTFLYHFAVVFFHCWRRNDYDLKIKKKTIPYLEVGIGFFTLIHIHLS